MTRTTLAILLTLLSLPMLALGQGRNDLLGRTYHDAAADAHATGLPLVVFVDCEPMPVNGGAIIYHATASEWRKLTGRTFRGAVVATPDRGELVVTQRVSAPSREVEPTASPFEREFRFPPFEALLKGLPFEDRPELTVDDSSKAAGPWPKDVPFIHGLVHYKPTRYTQQIAKLNSTSRISRVSRFNPSIETKWHQPGGLEGVKGWRSDLYKKVPEPGVREWQTGILVRNSITPGPNGQGSQVEIGIKREYPVGTIFIDSLSFNGKPFELRVAEKVSLTKNGWHRYVAFRDRDARPPGYHGLRQLCIECHNTVNNPFAMSGNGPGAGKYTGGLIPGGDTVVSDSFRSF